MGEQFAIRKVEDRIQVFDIVFGEDIILFCEGGLHRLRRRSHGWACIRANDFDEGRSQHVVHREKDDVLLNRAPGTVRTNTASQAEWAGLTEVSLGPVMGKRIAGDP